MKSRGEQAVAQERKREAGGGRIKNMGPKGSQWLESIGIKTREDLERVGSVEAYKRLKESIPGVSILALYAMEAALWDLHWNALPEEIKASLQEQVGHTPPNRAARKGTGTGID
ncbi:TfoX/Sxy family protein [Paenibacillus mucilaginosus]|uniref:TfoX/Sxy family protein n=1 Tax=Paenibacillus mucilaginosus TaxID=61624 RepID=UPI001F3B477D|nr:TfoX/Sxy family protein [Paenibacillus mucilaginosus]MCG7211671.1 TfoX/Sxy family protein [Paenibacillus mucilaginosus]